MDRSQRYGGNSENSPDYPVYSRLFVVCDKNISEDCLHNAFSKYGEIEDIKIPNDKQGRPKGICFIKFSRTSEAARALEALHLTAIPGSNWLLKISVAVNPSEVDSKDDDTLKYRRLFISIPKVMTEDEIEEIFSPYGIISAILIIRDQNTGDSKGFAYVTYNKFSCAADAFENCDKKFRAIFAKPKSNKAQESNFESEPTNFGSNTSLISMLGTKAKGFTKVNFICSPNLQMYHMQKIFGLIPGLIGFKYIADWVENCGKGTASYSNATSAAYAVEKLDHFEYPCPGQFIYVKPDNSSFNPVEKHITNDVPTAISNLKNAVLSAANSDAPDLAKLSKAIAEAQKLVKAATGVTFSSAPESTENYCSVPLPPTKPLADIDSKLGKRCFLVCKPSPPPLTVLRDVFCRFGDLINVYTLPNKTVGYARYASAAAAEEAIKTLHGAEICGVRIKVLEAEDEAPPKRRRFE